MSEQYYSIKDIANELGVSKTAVRKKIDDKLKTENAKVAGNKLLFNKNGKDIIVSRFKDKSETKKKKKLPTESEIVLDIISVLREQLAEKDKQIENLQISNSKMQKLLDQEQQLHLVEQQKNQQLLIDLSVTKKHQGFLSWLFQQNKK